MQMHSEQTLIEQTLSIEARALEERLAARDPEFRQLQVIRRALAELKAARTGNLNSKGGNAAGAIYQPAGINEAARLLIEEAGEPLAVADIFASLPKYGKIPAGKRPQWLLSNLLSADKKRFQSVPWKGKKRWWLRDKELPKDE